MENILQSFSKYWLVGYRRNKSLENLLTHIKAFLIARNVTDLSTVTGQMVTDYFSEMKPKCSEAKWYQMVWALRSFSNWAKITGIVYPKLKRPIQKDTSPITVDELANKLEPRLIHLFPANTLQVKAILYVLFYTGLEISDLVKIRRDDFRVVLNELIYNGNRVPLHRNLVIVIEKYFGSEAENAYWVKKPNAFNTSIAKLNRIFAILMKDKPLGEQRAVGAHEFRSAFANYCYQKGISVFIVQQLMMTKDIKTTISYLSDEVKADYLKKTKE